MVKPETKPTELPSPFKAPAIAERLKAEQAKLATLQKRHKLAALDTINGAIGNDLATVKAEIKATLAEIEDLTAAHAAAIDADEEKKRLQYSEHYKSEIRSCRQHLTARNKAGEAMSAALTEVMKQWHILLEHSAKARASVVIGKWPNSDVYIEFSSIKRLVEQELFRLGGDGRLGNKKSFPGAVPHDYALLNQPEKTMPLTSKLSEASEYLLNILTGKAGAE